jgi:hypothetical protein
VPEQTDGVLVDLAIVTPAPPAVLAMTLERTDVALVELSIAPSILFPPPSPSLEEPSLEEPSLDEPSLDNHDLDDHDLVTTCLRTPSSACPAPILAPIVATPCHLAVLATRLERTDGALVDLSIAPASHGVSPPAFSLDEPSLDDHPSLDEHYYPATTSAWTGYLEQV